MLEDKKGMLVTHEPLERDSDVNIRRLDVTTSERCTHEMVPIMCLSSPCTARLVRRPGDVDQTVNAQAEPRSQKDNPGGGSKRMGTQRETTDGDKLYSHTTRLTVGSRGERKTNDGRETQPSQSLTHWTEF